jgi:glycosyltransferase involved in cell wall biosynthesis
MFASELIRALQKSDVSQRVGVLSDSGSGRLDYDAPTHLLGSDGWMAPALRIRPQTLLALRRLINEWRPDIVQAYGGSTLKYTIPATLARRTAVVYLKIGLTPPDVSGRMKRAGQAGLMRRTNRVVAIAEAVQREVVTAFRVPLERVVTISNAVDPGRMKMAKGRAATRRALGISLTSPVVLSIGALTWEKDPVAHVQIGARVIRQQPDAVHVMVGDGPFRPQIEDAIRRNNLDGKMKLLRPRSDVPDLLNMSDVLLLASRTEGMPTCVIEAGMMGIPVAAYGIAGVPEVVVDGVTGRLATGGDTDGLAASVLELLRDPEASRVMGEAARERCLSRFDIQAIAPRYLRLYEELLIS